jgi:threonine synthase
MDIMVSSNFERLLFDLYGREGAEIQRLMSEFESGHMSLSDPALESARSLFSSFRLDDTETLDLIAEFKLNNDYLLDPHTAIGVAAARSKRKNHSTPMVCLATAHPAKFPEAVEKAAKLHPQSSLVTPSLPAYMKDVFDREERCEVLDDDISIVHDYIVTKLASQ